MSDLHKHLLWIFAIQFLSVQKIYPVFLFAVVVDTNIFNHYFEKCMAHRIITFCEVSFQ